MQKAIKLEIYRNLYTSICEEMGVSLKRSSFSPNIKERGDFSCAIFNRYGEMISHAAHIPVHLGAMPLCVENFLKDVDLLKDEVGILNDPFSGGTHLPDITLIKPIFYKGKRLFFVATRAHHADIGGIAPGSMAPSSDIFQEGFVIPPMKLIKGGILNEDFMKLFLANTRNAYERKADLMAQLASLKKGEARLLLYLERYGEEFVEYGDLLIDYVETCMRSKIREIPDGTYTFFDFMDDDGFETSDIKIQVTIEISKDSAKIDFSGTSKQVLGCINAPFSVTLSATLYVFRSLLEEEIPLNHGINKPIDVFAKKGTLVFASYPASCAGGNVETSQRIVDVLLGALSKAIPKNIPAASSGTMNNISFGDANFAYYETIGGGTGASFFGDGESAIHSHMTNTKNTPIETLETYYPVMVTEYRIRKDSYGKGRHKGGCGIVREFLFLKDLNVSVISDRRKRGPFGLFGGESGDCGKNLKISGNVETILPSKFTTIFKKGERLRIETPGGGGFGKID